jgi:hypothetical protein
MRILWLVLLAFLTACSGTSYVLEEYSSVTVDHMPMPDDTYRIYDKPQQGKMMVTSSLGASFAQGAGQGLLMNAVDNTPPKPRFDAAALAYLEKSGRRGCRVVESYILIKPQFEVKYECPR